MERRFHLGRGVVLGHMAKLAVVGSGTRHGHASFMQADVLLPVHRLIFLHEGILNRRRAERTLVCRIPRSIFVLVCVSRCTSYASRLSRFSSNKTVSAAVSPRHQVLHIMGRPDRRWDFSWIQIALSRRTYILVYTGVILPIP